MKTPAIALSFRRIAIAQSGATILAAMLWWCGSLLGGYEMNIAIAGAGVAGILLLVSLTVLALFSPEKKRPIATVATLWSATSFVRFLLALGASYLLYYVAHYDPRSLLFSFLLTAVFLLVAETKVLANSLADFGTTTKD